FLCHFSNPYSPVSVFTGVTKTTARLHHQRLNGFLSYQKFMKSPKFQALAKKLSSSCKG
ncbi:unnamed protein product, partial [Brassica oleracea var. botrytis]